LNRSIFEILSGDYTNLDFSVFWEIRFFFLLEAIESSSEKEDDD